MREYSTHPNPKLVGLRFPADIEQNSLYYRFMHRLSHIMNVTYWNTRAYNRHNEPADGSVLYLANHQSFYDPILVCGPLQRPGNFMARDTLFKNPHFAKLLYSVNTFPVKRGQADVGAMKEAMRRLKAGGTLVIFPEGTRTVDGRIGQFLPGSAMLSMKVATWTVPVLIDGAYQAWPKSQLLPTLGSKIVVQYGKAIHRDEAKQHTPAEFVNIVRQKMIDMQTKLHQHLGKPALKYD